MACSTNFDIVFGERLSQILSHSPTSKLIECRLVSRQWRYEATRILLKRRDLKIQFQLTSRQPFNESPTFYTFKSGDRPRRREYGNCSLLPSCELLGELPGDRTLDSFSHRISPSLPIGHFDFRFQFFGMNHPQLSSFLLGHGQAIKALTLDNYIFYSDSQSGLTNSILQYTPNLESLYIRQTYRRKETPWQIVSAQNNAVSLRRLKTIEIYHEPKNRRQTYKTIYELIFGILPHLLETAPQLERISFPSYFNPSFLKFFLRSKINMLLIRTLYLDAKDLFFGGLETLEEFVQTMMKSPQGIGLRHLRICVDVWPRTAEIWRRGIVAIRAILAANVHSLEEITLVAGGALMLHKTPCLPVLDKVKKLSVNLREHGGLNNLNPNFILGFFTEQGENFPGNSLPGLFPNLEILDLLQWHWKGEDADQKWFPYWNDRLMRVKTLKVKTSDNYGELNRGDGKITSTYAMSLKVCPETTNFTTCWPYDEFPLLFPPLCSLAQLTTLHVEFYHVRNWDAVTDIFIDLDAALTGMPKESVSTIYKNWVRCGRWELPNATGVNGEDHWQLRTTNSSFTSLKSLRKLHLEFRICFPDEPKMLISGVSAKFAFDLMPKLEVLLAFDFFGSTPFCTCSLNNARRESFKHKWLTLHSPLSSFPNVTVGLKEELLCCTINDGEQCDFE